MQRMRKNKLVIFLFMLPVILFFLGVLAFPLLTTIGLSFFEWGIGGIEGYLGLGNYARMITTDSVLRSAVSNTFLITLMSLLIQVPFAVLLAYLLRNLTHGKGFFRTALFLPNMISSAAAGLLWMFVFYPKFGVFNILLETLGLGNYVRVWLGDESTAIWCVIFATSWQYTGYHMIIHLCAMEEIPSSIMEAAQIDGAGPWNTFWRITLPGIAGIIKIDMVLVATGSLRVFDLVYAMTEGGPNHATEVLASHIYIRTFRGLQFGYGSALAVVLMILCLLVTGMLNVVFKRLEDLT